MAYYRLNSREITTAVQQFIEEDFEDQEYDTWKVYRYKNNSVGVLCYKESECKMDHSIECRYFSPEEKADCYITKVMAALKKAISKRFENAQIKKIEPKEYHYTEAYEVTMK